jgi:hypothetical protein
MSVQRKVWLPAILSMLAITAGCGRMTMMLAGGGKVYPAPNNGDVLKFRDQKNQALPVQWIGGTGGGVYASPCREQLPPHNPSDQSDTCTVKFHTTKIKVYHYICSGCADPSVPGPHANGGRTPYGVLPIASRNGATIDAQVGPEDAKSGVWAYFPDGSYTVDSMTLNIGDQIVWEPAGDATWQAVMQPQTCTEGWTKFPDQGSTCTIANTATSQTYCVYFKPISSGNPTLTVKGTTPTGNPPPTCPQ